MKTCWHTDIDGLPISLEQRGRASFQVRYWQSVKAGLTYAQAAAELGAAIMHASACAGKLDNRERGER